MHKTKAMHIYSEVKQHATQSASKIQTYVRIHAHEACLRACLSRAYMVFLFGSGKGTPGVRSLPMEEVSSTRALNKF